jgi:hypothetical protein
MRKTIHTLAKALPLVGLMALTVDANSQEGCITNGDGGTVRNLSSGTITFVEDGSYIENNSANTASFVNEGTLEFSATNHVSRIPAVGAVAGALAVGSAGLPIGGLTDWNGTAGQDVLPLYYNDLTVSEAGTKTFATGETTFIAGDYSIGGTSGTRDYTGSTLNFNYADPTTAGDSQTIPGESNYNNIVMSEAGDKTILAATTAIALGTTEMTSTSGSFLVAGNYTGTGNFTQDAAAGSIDISGAGDLELAGSGAAHNLAGDVNLNSGDGSTTATLAVNAADNGTAEFGGTVTVTEGVIDIDAGTGTFSGTIALVDDVNSTLDVADNSTFEVSGTFTNARDERDNMTFAANSTALYSNTAAQNVISSSDANPYGNLTLTGGDKGNAVGDETETNVVIAGDFSLTGGNFTVDDNQANDASDARSLVMADNTQTISFDSDAEEVIGGVRWVAGTTGFTNGTTYTLANADASFSFPNATGTAGAAGNYLELRSYPDALPRGYDADTDVDRLYQLWYDYTTWSDITLQLSWKEADEGTWAADATRDETVRFWESDGPDATTDIEKIVTGVLSAYNRNQAGGTDFNTTRLAGIDPGTLPSSAENVDGTPDSEFGHTNDFVLRSGPTIFYTINNGRWSNPATWDEGIEPTSNDEAVILHTVHAGYTRTIDGFGTAEATPGALATSIRIDPNAANGGASLLIGGSANFATTGDEGTLEIVQATTRNISAPDDAELIAGTDTNQNALYNGGLYIFNGSNLNVTGCFTTNNGDFGNAGQFTSGDTN